MDEDTRVPLNDVTTTDNDIRTEIVESEETQESDANDNS